MIIARIAAGGAVILAGHSTGGVVAYEMTRRLEQQGRPVELLVIFDTTLADGAPQQFYAGIDDQDWIDWMVELFEPTLSDVPEMTLDAHGSLRDEEENYRFISDFLKRHDLLARNAPLAQVKALLKVFKTSSLAHLRYRPASVIKTPIALFLAEELPKRAARLEQRPQGWGWPEHTRGGVDIHWVAGNHVNLLNTPQVDEVARQLTARLETGSEA